MRRSLITIAATTATLIALGAAPAYAGQVTPGTCDGTGTSASTPTSTARPTTRPTTRPAGTRVVGTLTDAQKAALADMAREEKLAGDLYEAFAAAYPQDARFARIAAAEDTHLATLRSLMSRYGVTDPTLGLPVGQFASAEFAAMYADLLAEGQQGLSEALAVGAAVERADIADLREAGTGVSVNAVTRVYTNLAKASASHLASFTR